MASSKKVLRSLLLLASILLAFAVLLLYAYNDWSLVVFVAAAVSIVCAFPSARPTAALLVVTVICAVVTWAILDGGAEEWTAISPALGGACALALAIWTTVRRHRPESR